MSTLVPEDLDLRRPDKRVLTSFFRAAAGMARARSTKSYADELIRSTWPNDRDALQICKGSVSPTSMTDVGAPLRTLTASLLGALGPTSAGAQLLSAGLQLEFDPGVSAISLPWFPIDASVGGGFVAEGQPARVVGLTASPQLLHPKKMVVITNISREMAESASFVEIVQEAVSRNTGLALDSVLFSNSAASDAAPAGLLEGVVPLVASVDPAGEAMLFDLESLIGAVAPVAGNGSIALIVNPVRAAAINLRSRRELPYLVLASNAVPAGDVIAIALPALVSATAGAPTIDVSNVPAMHLEGASPLALSVPGTPPVVSAPVMSTWQSDVLSIRLRLKASWALRSPLGIAFLSTAAW